MSNLRDRCDRRSSDRRASPLRSRIASRSDTWRSVGQGHPASSTCLSQHREPLTGHSALRGNTVVPPIAADAAVLRVKGTPYGIAVKTDGNPRYCYLDPYLGGMHAVAEACRNLSCTGAEPLGITDCLNFGNPERPEIYFQLARAIDGMAAACRALNVPVVSGNVSLYNQSGDNAILPSPTVGVVGRLADVTKHATMAFTPEGSVYLIGPATATLGASEYLATVRGKTAGAPPPLDLALEEQVQRLVRSLIADGLVRVVHDCAEGGLAVALAECCITGETGGQFDVAALLEANDDRLDRTLFGESGSRVIIQVTSEHETGVLERLQASRLPYVKLGRAGGERLILQDLLDVPLAELSAAWSSALNQPDTNPAA